MLRHDHSSASVCPAEAVTRATTAGKSARAGRPLERRPAYPVLSTGLWRGDAAPPFEPPGHRAAAVATGGRGRRPRTPVPVRPWPSGVPLWSRPASPLMGGRSQPHSPPNNGESGSGGCERTAAMPTGFETHGGANAVAEGGAVFRYCESDPEGDPGKSKLLVSRASVARGPGLPDPRRCIPNSVPFPLRGCLARHALYGG